MKAKVVFVESPGFSDERNIRLILNELSMFSIEASYTGVSIDNQDGFLDAVGDGIDNCDIILTVGGMTDLTRPLAKEILCDALDIALLPHNPSVLRLREAFEKQGRRFVEDDIRLALVPEGARVFQNTVGFLSGFSLESQGQAIIMLPDNADEYVAMFMQFICPYIKSGTGGEYAVRTLKAFGLNRAEAEQMIKTLRTPVPASISVLEGGGELYIRIFCVAETKLKALSLTDTAAKAAMMGPLGTYIYGNEGESMAEVVVNKLKARGMKISTAESCTGGLVSERITEVSGSSAVFEFGVSAYADSVKEEKLGVSSKLIKQFTSVSEETAVAMAAGVMEQGHADIGIGITGIAGPNSDDNGKPVGLVYVSMCDKNGVWVKRLTLDPQQHNRESIRNIAALTALDMARRYLDALPAVPDEMVPFTLRSTKSYVKAAALARAQYEAGAVPDEREEKPVKSRKGRQEEPGVKKNPWRRFVEYMFPVKGDTGMQVFLKIVALVLAVVFIAAAGYIAYYYGSAFLNKKNVDELNTLYGTGSLPEGYPSDYIEDFAALYAKNPDVKAFIEIKGTGVKYPVVQSSDNDFYLRRNFLKESNRHGIPFIDYRVDVKNSVNTVVYGHNMKDGQMFGELVNYKDIEYYKQHPVINFDTVYARGEYKIISAFITNTNPAHGEVFDYTSFINPQGGQETDNFLAQVKARSLFSMPVDIQEGDDFLTLSTCTYEFDEARFVIVARKVRQGESAEVDVSKATKNKQPLYPDIWYTLYGGTKPDLPVLSTGGEMENGETPPPLVSEPDDGKSVTDGESSEEISSQEESSEESSSSKAASSSKPSSSSSKPVSSSSKEASSLESSSSKPASSSEESEPEEESSSRASQQPESQPHSSRASSEPSREETSSTLGVSTEKLTVYSGGSYVTDDAYTILCQVVASEMNDTIATEALKAQAVAAHSYILNTMNSGGAASVGMRTPSTKIKNAVKEVVDKLVYVNGRVAYTPYFAIAADNTNSAKDVWGGSYSHLVSVESDYDSQAAGYMKTKTLTEDYVWQKVTGYFGREPEGDPSDWFQVDSYTSGGYNDKMTVGGISTTARTLREKVFVNGGVFDLRSTKFDVTYDGGKFTFTTYGYGHGVGMSQMGADGYARNAGWSYDEILEHYYSGATVE